MRSGHRPAPRRRQGFTVIEMLIVLVVAGLIGAVTIHKFSDIGSQQRISKAALALASDFQEAFQIAARNRAPVRVVWNDSTLQFALTNRWSSYASATVFRRTGVGVGSGLGLTSANVSVYPATSVTSHVTQLVEVYPNGFATDTINIQLSSGTYRRTIRVSRAGLVRVQ